MTDNTIDTHLSDRARRNVLIGLMLTMALVAMDTTVVATAIPSIVQDLGGFSQFTWIFSIYVLVQAVTIPIYGKLADLYGRKPILLFGVIIFIGGSILSGIAWNMFALIAFRGLQGIGAGAIQPVVTTVAGDLYTVKERARIQGWLSSVWGIAGVVGPAIGGFFAEYLTWRWIFYINLPLGALSVFVIWKFLHEDVERKQHKIDYFGSTLLAVGLGTLIFGVLEGGVRWPWLSRPIVIILVTSLVVMIAFVIQERRAAEPTVPLWVYSKRVLIGANLATASLGFLSIGLTTFLPTFAEGVLGISALFAGFVLSAMSISWPISSAYSGRVYLRIGFRDTALIGSLICAVAAIGFYLLPESVPIWLVVLISFLIGSGFGFLSTSLIVGVQSLIDWNRRGVVTGANLFSRQLGQALGAAIYGSIANAVLLGKLHDAPPSLAGQLPTNLNDASAALNHQTTNLSVAAEAYLREALFQATHQVFLTLAIIAVITVVVLLGTPRIFERLRFGDDDVAAQERVDREAAKRPAESLPSASLPD
ncbi:MAG TPA: MDR family MFS transporter [Nitrolancea sp.]|nr:MDR family MFS transporter [Nitrolancea sp.]